MSEARIELARNMDEPRVQAERTGLDYDKVCSWGWNAVWDCGQSEWISISPDDSPTCIDKNYTPFNQWVFQCESGGMVTYRCMTKPTTGVGCADESGCSTELSDYPMPPLSGGAPIVNDNPASHCP